MMDFDWKLAIFGHFKQLIIEVSRLLYYKVIKNTALIIWRDKKWKSV